MGGGNPGAGGSGGREGWSSQNNPFPLPLTAVLRVSSSDLPTPERMSSCLGSSASMWKEEGCTSQMGKAKSASEPVLWDTVVNLTWSLRQIEMYNW